MITPREPWDVQYFYAGITAIRRAYQRHRGFRDPRQEFRNDYLRYIDRFKLHPVVESILEQHRPLDWQRLLFEWPHISVEDQTKIAYARDERGIINDIQTRTTIGKYLTRHWPNLPAHIIRDFTASFSPDRMWIANTTKEIIWGIENGPRSCMQSTYGGIPFRLEDSARARDYMLGNTDVEVPWHKHPYSVYSPDLGWGIALRQVHGESTFAARALVHISEQKFVRTYSSGGNDPMLEQWLLAQGYEHDHGWRGAEIAKLQHPDRYSSGFLLPYIDGSAQRVEHSGDVFEIVDEDGDFVCTNTNGTGSPAEREDYIGDCEDCGENVYEDDNHIYAGRHDDRLICGGCMDAYPNVRASSRYGSTTYYLHEDDARGVYNYDGDLLFWIDPDHRPENVVWVDYESQYALLEDVVRCEADDEWYYVEDTHELANGEFALKRDCWEDGNGEYHHIDTDAISYGGELWLKDDAWQCAGTLLWFPEHITPVEDDHGETYHPDYFDRVNSDAEDESIVELRTQAFDYIDISVSNPVPGAQNDQVHDTSRFVLAA